VTEGRLQQLYNAKFGPISSPAQYVELLAKARKGARGAARAAGAGRPRRQGRAVAAQAGRPAEDHGRPHGRRHECDVAGGALQRPRGRGAGRLRDGAGALALRRHGGVRPAQAVRGDQRVHAAVPRGCLAGLQGGAEVYKALSANPQFRSLYFTNDVEKVMESYTSAVNGKADPKAAYTTAYQSVSPEAKAAAEKFSQTPEFQRWSTRTWPSSSPARRSCPRGSAATRVQNPDFVQAAAATELRSWRAQNPGALARRRADAPRVVHQEQLHPRQDERRRDPHPPGFASGPVQEAFSDNSKAIADKLDLKSRSDGDWTVQYIRWAAKASTSRWCRTACPSRSSASPCRSATC
jgi:hypothetical protein